MNPKSIPDEAIFSFCTNILPEFHTIMKNLKELQNDLSLHDCAMNLMDLGRGQISEIDEPSEQDVEFIIRYTKSLHLDNTSEAFFTAYAGGCIMGLVTINEVAREDFSKALSLIEQFSQKEFNSKD